MKLVTYRKNKAFDCDHAGVLDGERVIDITGIVKPESLGRVDITPTTVQTYITRLTEIRKKIESQPVDERAIFVPRHKLNINAPVQPRTLRDFYAFEDHVKTSRAKRGLDMVPEWYEFPVFYFSNPHSIYGPEASIPYPKSSHRLDFELEIAAVISKYGEDIPVEEADQYIAGYMIMNDWSARDIQAQEMKVGLGPAKGKDFATSLGPWLVTPDELEDRRSGKGYDLAMVARRNGVEISRGNWNTIYYSFAEMIARASEDTMLYPGDVIGSGTVGTGCLLELGPENVGGYLRPGDEIELEVERLGVLHNTIVKKSKPRT